MEDVSVVVFFILMLGISMLTGWLMGARYQHKHSADNWYSGYSEGYNTALDDMEKLVKTKTNKKKTTKKATTTRKVKK